MFETIAKGFSSAKDLLRKSTTLNEDNISLALKEVRLSLLEADVEYSVVKSFIEKVKERAVGLSIKTAITDKKGQTHKLSPYEHFIGICYEELEALMGPEASGLKFTQPISSFMMVGLQGSGKTTSSAKLARLLKEEYGKKPLLVAADIYRPGAFHQLQVLGERLNVPVFHIEHATAQEICHRGQQKAKELQCNVIIFDTAGRLAIDEVLMQELNDIKALVKPEQIFLVVDAMIGQDAVNTAQQFNDRLDISGVILTKLDGDARGGAALSIKHVTNKPIKFLGLGEDLNSLEHFRPQGMASRILGLGDVVSLAKDFEKHVDEKEAEADAKRLLAGSFSFDDFIKQLNLIKKLGSFQSIIDRMPGMRDMFSGMPKIEDRDFIKFEAMVSSMTKLERSRPDLLVKEKSRRARISKGCGRKPEEVDQMIERFVSMRQLMQTLGKNPRSMEKMPMFQQMDRMGEIAKKYGSSPEQLMSMMGSGGFGPGGFGPAGRFVPPMPGLVRPKQDSKNKKDKRKNQKLARKKSKQRK